VKTSVIILFLFLTSSCALTVYSPTSYNVPLLEKKGQKNISVNLGVLPLMKPLILDVQGAYAISDHIGFIGSGSIGGSSRSEFSNWGYGYMGEVGLGYHTNLSTRFIFETYALFGTGSVRNDISIPQDRWGLIGYFSANLNKASIQPSVAYKSKRFTMALASRLSMLNVTNLNGELRFYGASPPFTDIGKYLDPLNQYFLIEPTITFRFSKPKTAWQIQLGFSHSLTWDSEGYSYSDLQKLSAIFSTGLNMTF